MFNLENRRTKGGGSKYLKTVGHMKKKNSPMLQRAGQEGWGLKYIGTDLD